ncbi:hypothetical protein L226DRAFT_278126 [Lentinus tigrinus ALCF2SS1-7]|uniref:uncharacterized protein n=1 Tax=Lentinus tigrinus ALCF2SS1-7 TaxID=1328758 RepID=UPI0011660F42|nr:hypothetical protein L226DRAFT_278126 [Lentinus tigrinus ALCF2SS1-7]
MGLIAKWYRDLCSSCWYTQPEAACPTCGGGSLKRACLRWTGRGRREAREDLQALMGRLVEGTFRAAVPGHACPRPPAFHRYPIHHQRDDDYRTPHPLQDRCATRKHQHARVAASSGDVVLGGHNSFSLEKTYYLELRRHLGQGSMYETVGPPAEPVSADLIERESDVSR